MLVSATEQLTAFAAEKRFEQCTPLVLAIVELSEMFEPLRPRLPQIEELLNHKDRLLEDLKAECLEDIEGKLFTPGYDPENKFDVKAACETAAAIGKEVKDDVISMYNAEHREYFPSEWRVDKQLCLHYCHLTRQHLVDLLAATAAPGQTEDAGLLFQLAVKNIEMENDLDKRYSRGDGDMSFKGIVSNCFEPYLSVWVDHGESLLCSKVDEAAAKENPEIVGSKRGSVPSSTAVSEGAQTEPVFVYTSVVELFTKMKKLFKNCKSVSTSNTMFLLCVKSFRVALDRYTDKVLSSRVRSSSSDEQIYAVAGSCVYITQTLPLLAGSISETIDEPLKAQINFAKQMEEAADVETQAIEQLSSRTADQCMRRVTQFLKDDKKSWTSVDSADVNAVTSRAHRSLTANLREAAQGLTEPQYSAVAEGVMAKIIEDYCTLIFTGIKEPVDSTERVELLSGLTGGLQTLLLEAPVEGASAAGENTMEAMHAYSAVTCRRMQLVKITCLSHEFSDGRLIDAVPAAVKQRFAGLWRFSGRCRFNSQGEDAMRVEIIQAMCADREDTPTEEAIDQALSVARSMQHGGGISGRIARDGSSSIGSAGASSGPASMKDGSRSGTDDVGPMAAQFGAGVSLGVSSNAASAMGDNGQGDVAAKMQQMFKNIGEQWKTKFVNKP
ncbi:Vacuolar protein sorting-associated protein 53 [Perkinsus olseni]|uniref:Vacuolar protein sorting-associated protein 53 n=1 Tax=Perkinsus olseni TaxID=32597 RepID=A0A7J6N543_PEROL|nr:Vacuolar protein sorting-associated protein 53 [Perkinsus olseni]